MKWEDTHANQLELSVGLARALFPSKYPLSDEELLLLLHTARSLRANPMLNEIYGVKYTANDRVAIVVGYHYFLQRAQENPRYAGFTCWCVGPDGKRIADGTEDPKKVTAAICVVKIKGFEEPVKFVARNSEFNKHQAQWNSMPIHMLTKCAIANAHRQACPNMSGMYLEEEFGQEYVEEQPPQLEAGAEPETTEAPAEEIPAEAAPETPEEEPAGEERAESEAPAEQGNANGSLFGDEEPPLPDPEEMDDNGLILELGAHLKRVTGADPKIAQRYLSDKHGTQIKSVKALVENMRGSAESTLTDLRRMKDEQLVSKSKA